MVDIACTGVTVVTGIDLSLAAFEEVVPFGNGATGSGMAFSTGCRRVDPLMAVCAWGSIGRGRRVMCRRGGRPGAGGGVTDSAVAGGIGHAQVAVGAIATG